MLISPQNIECYKVFAIVVNFDSKREPYRAVYVGQCDTPSGASQIMDDAIKKQLVTNPKFVLLVPETQLDAICPESPSN